MRAVCEVCEDGLSDSAILSKKRRRQNSAADHNGGIESPGRGEHRRTSVGAAAIAATSLAASTAAPLLHRVGGHKGGEVDAFSLVARSLGASLQVLTWSVVDMRGESSCCSPSTSDLPCPKTFPFSRQTPNR